jgi:hypothetical protein
MKEPLQFFPMVAGSYQSRSPRFDCQRTVNLYPEMTGSGNSKSIAMLIGTPGTKTWNSIIGPTGLPLRGMIRFTENYAVIVRGGNVYRIDSLGTEVLIGTIPLTQSPVSMASNGQTIMMVTGPNGYFINPVAGTMTQIFDPSFVGADVVWFLNGRFVWNRPGTQIYQWSALYSTTIDPLAFASAEGSPDLLVSLIASNKELVLLGETSTEFAVNSGDPDSAFESIQGAFIEQGCAAKYSVAKMTDGPGTGTIIWLSRNEQGQGIFVRLVGYQPQRISNHALEYQLAQYERIDDAVAYTYQQEGHSFYMVSFPAANKTLCYDTSTELWHERAWRNPADGSMNRHRSWNHMNFAGKTLVGDWDTGTIWELDLNTYADRAIFPYGSYQETMPSIRQCPHLSAGDAWQLFHELWIDMETGVGLPYDISVNGTSQSGKDPSLILEWSDDGGYSFPYSREIKIGKIGERKLRAVARRLGKSKDRVFRVTITDPVRRVFINAGCRTTVAA